MSYHGEVISSDDPSVGGPAQGRVDIVERLREDWRAVRPDVDTSSIEVFGRIARTAALASAANDHLLDGAGVSRSEFDVLCVLARAERPLRASDVTAQTLVSGAATTKLAARLEQAGLLVRERLERDGRVVLLALTAAGRRLVDEWFPRCMTYEQSVLDDLDPEERRVLAALLRRLMASAERP